MDNMITDRPNADTYYNYTDLNRVEAAAAEVADLLTAEGYYITITVKTDWARGDLPYKSQMDRYIGNLHYIERQFAPVEGAELPETMAKLDYMGANNIEKFLAGIPPMVEEMIANYRQCNGFECGEE